MVEIRGDKKVLVTPVSAEDLKDIKIGDIVWLDGDLMTCRDVAHRRLVEYGRELPYDIKDKAIFHAGPIVRKIEGTENDYEMVSVGPTTSMRMEKFEYEFTKQTGVRVIVGKGGMGPNTERACKEFGAIHCVFPAGCADRDPSVGGDRKYSFNIKKRPCAAPGVRHDLHFPRVRSSVLGGYGQAGARSGAVQPALGRQEPRSAGGAGL